MPLLCLLQDHCAALCCLLRYLGCVATSHHTQSVKAVVESVHDCYHDQCAHKCNYFFCHDNPLLMLCLTFIFITSCHIKFYSTFYSPNVYLHSTVSSKQNVATQLHRLQNNNSFWLNLVGVIKSCKDQIREQNRNIWNKHKHKLIIEAANNTFYGILLWEFFICMVCSNTPQISKQAAPVADLGFWKGGFQCARDWSHKAREARALGGVARGGHVPPGKFLISDLLISLLVPFWSETAGVGRLTANLVIVFEAFKRSHNLKAWLRFAPRRKHF